MSDTAFSNLPTELTAPADDDILGLDDISASETKKIKVSNLLGGATQAEMGHVHGVTSDIQTQINGLDTKINTKSDNILINQDFSIWQENTTFTNIGSGAYAADGYLVYKTDGGGTAPSINVKKNVSVHEDAFEQSCELEITNIGVADTTRRWVYYQKVEDYKKYRGKVLTLSVRVRASATINLTHSYVLISDGVAVAAGYITSITTDFVTYSATLTSTTSSTQLTAELALDAGGGTISTTGSIYIQYMKLELGSVATPLIPRSDEKELDSSQLHYQKTYAQGTFPGAAAEIGAVWNEIAAVASADHTITMDVKFPKVMHAAPTITLYDLAGNSGKVTMAAGNNITGTVSQISDSGFKISATNGAVSTSRKLAFHYTAVSRL